MARTFIKDPDAVLDYVFDWRGLTHGVEGAESDWLAEGETITSHTVTVSSGITLDSDSEADGAVTVWISGGSAGQTYLVTCSIETSQGRDDDRTMKFVVKER